MGLVRTDLDFMTESVITPKAVLYYYVFNHHNLPLFENLIGVSLSWIDDIVQIMRAAKMYLKTYFKLHVEEGSPCADHCVFYALSTDEAHWNSSCDHEHSVECDRCSDLDVALNDIIATLKTVDNSQG